MTEKNEIKKYQKSLWRLAVWMLAPIAVAIMWIYFLFHPIF